MSWDASPGRYRGVPTAVAARVRKRDRHTCQQCGAPGREVDHIVNVKAGGTDALTNLQVLCPLCHITKTQAESRAGRTRTSRRRPPERHPGLL